MRRDIAIFGKVRIDGGPPSWAAEKTPERHDPWPQWSDEQSRRNRSQNVLEWMRGPWGSSGPMIAVIEEK